MLARIGTYVAIYGMAAIIMGFFNYCPRLLMWIYIWGDTTAWIIKIALVLGGGILYLVGSKLNKQSNT